MGVGDEGALATVIGIEAQRAQELAEVDLDPPLRRAPSVAQRGHLVDRLRYLDRVSRAGDAQPRQRVADARDHRRALHAEQQPVVCLIVIREDGASERQNDGRRPREPVGELVLAGDRSDGALTGGPYRFRHVRTSAEGRRHRHHDARHSEFEAHTYLQKKVRARRARV